MRRNNECHPSNNPAESVKNQNDETVHDHIGLDNGKDLGDIVKIQWPEHYTGD